MGEYNREAHLHGLVGTRQGPLESPRDRRPLSSVPSQQLIILLPTPNHTNQTAMSSTGTIRGLNKGFPVQKLEVPKRPAARKGVSRGTRDGRKGSA